MYGYKGKRLRVDLSDKKITVACRFKRQKDNGGRNSRRAFEKMVRRTGPELGAFISGSGTGSWTLFT